MQVELHKRFNSLLDTISKGGKPNIEDSAMFLCVISLMRSSINQAPNEVWDIYTKAVAHIEKFDAGVPYQDFNGSILN